jgi:LysR family glycine cleavage system transcriptional activator
MCKPGLVSNLKNIQSLGEYPLLSDSTLLRFDDPCGWREWLPKENYEKITPLRELRFGNGLLALEAALSGQGILLGMKSLLAPELLANKLEVVIDRPMLFDQAYYVVSAGLSNERTIARQFREWLLDEASKSET